MRVVKECDRIDYMNSVPLHEFFGEDIVVDCEKFVYIARLIKTSMETLGLYPLQQTDAERYGSDSRVLYLQRNSTYDSSPILSYGQMHGGGRSIGDLHTHQHVPIWTTSWVDAGGTEQPVENTAEQEREYGLLRRIYNRVCSILLYKL